VVKNPKTSDDQEGDEDYTTERERMTNQDARKRISGLRLHLMQEGNEGRPLYICTS
jgi:hypothetical protein